jgi:hypothetical protein
VSRRLTHLSLPVVHRRRPDVRNPQPAGSCGGGRCIGRRWGDDSSRPVDRRAVGRAVEQCRGRRLRARAPGDRRRTCRSTTRNARFRLDDAGRLRLDVAACSGPGRGHGLPSTGTSMGARPSRHRPSRAPRGTSQVHWRGDGLLRTLRGWERSRGGRPRRSAVHLRAGHRQPPRGRAGRCRHRHRTTSGEAVTLLPRGLPASGTAPRRALSRPLEPVRAAPCPAEAPDGRRTDGTAPGTRGRAHLATWPGGRSPPTSVPASESRSLLTLQVIPLPGGPPPPTARVPTIRPEDVPADRPNATAPS